MKRSKVLVQWTEGLHLRPASTLVKRALDFQSTISLKVNEQIADARSILAIIMLCASFGTVVEIEASGEDEENAMAAITAVFEAESSDTLD